MTKVNITKKIKDEYLSSIKDILLTPKTKKFTANTKRFYAFLKSNLHINRYSQVINLIVSDDIHSLIRQYGVITTNEEDYKIYDDFRKVWAKKLVSLSNLKVCPYCNRNFIMNVALNGTTVELDHFFPKTSYPYLAINLYNLIPSCHTCNHKKHIQKLKIYPYQESINDYITFSHKLVKLPYCESNIELLTLTKKNTRKIRKKINNYQNVLNISSLYENHKDIILELIQKAEIYNDSYIDELFNRYEGTLFKNREDLMRLITCGYITDEEISKRPLSKLIKDISEELRLI